MTYVDHAHIMLEFLAKRRDSHGAIAPVSNTDLLVATGKTPSHFGIAYGQANSFLDIASLRADLPLIGHLVSFDRGNEFSEQWANWLPFKTLVVCAPRLKFWTDEDIRSIRSFLEPGSPSRLWDEMGKESEKCLQKGDRLSTGGTASLCGSTLWS